MLKPHKIFLAAATMLLLGACTASGSTENRGDFQTPVVAENDPVTLRLTQAAEKAADALDNISAVESAANPPIAADDFNDAPEVLQQPTTITWYGPVEQIARTLATRAGYTFHTIGKAPSVPVVVSLNVYQKPLIKVLHDVGLQLGQRADLSVDAQRGVVEVHYAAPDRKG